MNTKYRLDCAVWELTLKCNLRCTHCGSSAGIPRHNELTTKECFSLCESLANVGCGDVALMGGEPFLKNDYYAIGRCAKDLGMNVSLVTNGTTMDIHIENVRRLEPSVVGISLDGMKENHEKIRGHGTWEKATKAIELLRAHGIQTTVITTVSRINYKDLPRMKDMLLGRKVNWQIQTAMPFGNFSREFVLSKEEFYATALFIAKERVENKFKDLPVVGAHCYGYYSKMLPGCVWDGCTAGIHSVGITSDGGVVGCLSMGNDRLIEGNVRETRFETIWNNPRSFAYNRCFETKDLGANCNGCKHGAACRGGCGSMSLNMTGMLHNDPYCFYALEMESKAF
jgi:radical SAM protein with 4Fe4S-binding SPASM domain